MRLDVCRYCTRGAYKHWHDCPLMQANYGPPPVVYDETQKFLDRQAVPVTEFKHVTLHMGKQYGKRDHASPPAIDINMTTAEAWEQLRAAFGDLVIEITKTFEPFARYFAKKIDPPATVMERALQSRKNRNTGPSRPSGQAAHRPRRHS